MTAILAETEKVHIISFNTSLKYITTTSTIIISHSWEALMQLQASSSIIHQLSWQTSLHSAHKTWMSLSWVNDRVGGPCQPGAWTRVLSTLQFTPSGQGGRGGRRKDEVDDRRNEAVTQMSAKTKGEPRKHNQTDLTTEIKALLVTCFFLFFWSESFKNRIPVFLLIKLILAWFDSLNDKDSFFDLRYAVEIKTLLKFNNFYANLMIPKKLFDPVPSEKQRVLNQCDPKYCSTGPWTENGEAPSLCWQPKTEISGAANCLNPQKVVTWASTACGFWAIQGRRGHVGTFPLALSDK